MVAWEALCTPLGKMPHIHRIDRRHCLEIEELFEMLHIRAGHFLVVMRVNLQTTCASASRLSSRKRLNNCQAPEELLKPP